MCAGDAASPRELERRRGRREQSASISCRRGASCVSALLAAILAATFAFRPDADSSIFPWSSGGPSAAAVPTISPSFSPAQSLTPSPSPSPLRWSAELEAGDGDFDEAPVMTSHSRWDIVEVERPPLPLRAATHHFRPFAGLRRHMAWLALGLGPMGCHLRFGSWFELHVRGRLLRRAPPRNQADGPGPDDLPYLIQFLGADGLQRFLDQIDAFCLQRLGFSRVIVFYAALLVRLRSALYVSGCGYGQRVVMRFAFLLPGRRSFKDLRVFFAALPSGPGHPRRVRARAETRSRLWERVWRGRGLRLRAGAVDLGPFRIDIVQRRAASHEDDGGLGWPARQGPLIASSCLLA